MQRQTNTSKDRQGHDKTGADWQRQQVETSGDEKKPASTSKEDKVR